ncbi:MAG: site-specific integrase [Cyanobacteria bacterium TGS_CYA1]|nr:site-specific integrase [Cyanobacteria bacterium TGS_CYA1]
MSNLSWTCFERSVILIEMHAKFSKFNPKGGGAGAAFCQKVKAMETRFNFTKKKLEALKPPLDSKQVYFWDTQVRGLCFSVAKGGSKAFVLRRKIQGRSERIWLGKFPDLTIEMARKLAYEKNAIIAGGSNPGDIRRLLQSEPTLEHLFESYIKRHAEKQRKTSNDMRQLFDRCLLKWKDRKASSIKNRDVEILHGKLGEERGPYTANRVVQLLRAVYNKATTWHLFSGENPAKGITLFTEKARERFLNKEEAVKLLKALENEPDRCLKDFIRLSLFTGVRKANLMSLRWEDVSWSERTFTIPETKNGTRQVVALGNHEINLLQERFEFLERKSKKENKAFSSYVFPGPGKDGHIKDLKRSWTTLRKRTGLEDVTIHDLRRSLASTMANANVNLSLVKNTMNHKDMKTTLSVYAHTHQEAIRDAKELALKPILQQAGLIKRKNRRRSAKSNSA